MTGGTTIRRPKSRRPGRAVVAQPREKAARRAPGTRHMVLRLRGAAPRAWLGAANVGRQSLTSTTAWRDHDDMRAVNATRPGASAGSDPSRAPKGSTASAHGELDQMPSRTFLQVPQLLPNPRRALTFNNKVYTAPKTRTSQFPDPTNEGSVAGGPAGIGSEGDPQDPQPPVAHPTLCGAAHSRPERRGAIRRHIQEAGAPEAHTQGPPQRT